MAAKKGNNKSGTTEKELTQKQKEFCKEYVYDWNGTRAYKAAYSTAKEDSTARTNASKLLTNTNIQQYIDFIQEDLSKLSGITAFSQLKELKSIAYGNAANLRSGWMNLKDFDDLTHDERSCIQEIVSTKTTFGENGEKEEIKIKVYSKQAALAEINKMLGYYAAEKREVKVVTGLLTKEDIQKELDEIGFGG